MNITRNQWIAISLLALGLISGATGQMTEIFGVGPARSISTAASLLSSFVAGVQIILGGQAMQVRDVTNMTGVERIRINENANSTLAAMAVDPANPKILPTPEAQAAITATAKQKDDNK